MKILKLTENNSRDLTEEARSIILNGGIIVYPGKNAYLLGVDVENPESIERIYEIKRRQRRIPIPTLVLDLDMAKRYVELNVLEEELVKNFLPGEVILACKKKNNLPRILNKDRLSFTFCKNRFTKDLVKLIDKPLTASSCNISGQDTNYSVKTIEKEILEDVDLVIDGGRFDKSPDYTVVDFTNGLNFIRLGEKAPDILNYFHKKYFNKNFCKLV